MTDPFIGEIRIFAGNFAPRNWAFCNGQLISISQNTALFSLLGTFYGGDGRTTFGLPNLQGRHPIGQGQGPGLQPYTIGEVGGEERHSLIAGELPAHTHPLRGTTAPADTSSTGGKVLGESARPAYNVSPPNVDLAVEAVGPGPGQGQPHENMAPYLAVSYIIALQGVFPARS